MKREDDIPNDTAEERRRFLAQCGRFAIVAPPAMTMPLSAAAKPQEAHASTILGGGWGHAAETEAAQAEEV